MNQSKLSFRLPVKLASKIAIAIVAGSVLLSAGINAKHHGKKMFEKMDTNADGVIDRAEFMASAEARFTKMDLNGDGSVSPDEAKALKEKMREKRREKREKRLEKLEQQEKETP